MNLIQALNLFIRPRQFFSGREIYNAHGIQLLCAWLVGMSTTADQIDKKLFAAHITGKVNNVATMAAESWGQYWAILAGVGLVGAFYAWFVGGWWYRKRLEFSGAVGVDPSHSRIANVYQSLVYDLPAMSLTVFNTFAFPNYLAAWQSDKSGRFFVVIPFLILSCWASFAAATTSFSVSHRKAVLWFFALPLAFYTAAFGLFSHLLRMANH